MREDRAIDKLLRAHFRQLQARGPCPGFDAELAAAYLRGRLRAEGVARYELHLSECASCRAELVRLASLVEMRKRAWLRPRWALAAAAVIVLAVSLPVLMWRNSKRAADPAVRASVAGPAQQAAQIAMDRSPVSEAQPARARAGRRKAAPRPSPPPAEIALSQIKAAAPEAPLALPESRSEPIQHHEAAPEPAPREERQPAASSLAVEPPPIAPQANVASKPTMELEPSQGRGGSKRGDEGGMLARIKNAFALIPKLPSAVVGLHRLIAPYSYRSSFAEKLTEPAERKSAESARKIGNKRFKLVGDVWIDDEYDADKDMPLIVVVREGALYRELIAGSDDLKLYLTSIPAHQGAIIVHKGKVYKLLSGE